ncbi:MAG: SDR family NAD(P)-dependent oxidoreductase [Candidatus Azotimanducaceae bacterium]|uniref:SDR family NAD(P)-dependent oxidoreductase n=1 Tax=OM182 bacterium TaxID=2510334 RepID=A0A520S494_9GAMM|nr:3-oxoacyl-ACP reductase [Gammaproteobacteria bacterium]OUV68205.1 MAG: 3-oxoacyl-ACP reductase [Gammaproteobacteria bacterium TMED133]RZO77305.1 MAG: SDR family NAD(P)-dependent oxidoreductase [OM182 bacterium]
MFKDKRVIVTGGAGILGQAVVDYYQTGGAVVAVLDYSDELLDTTYPKKNDNNLYLSCDLTDRASSVDITRSAIKKMGGVDILCNIAGGFLMGEDVHETKEQTWDFLFDLNARSIMNMASAVVPSMLDNHGGKIVNVAARAANAGGAKMGAYTASKAAVVRLTESMALELREQNINVNCVMPGIIDTPRNRNDMPDADHAKWVLPLDLAKVIGFLTSVDASSVHGASIPVDALS